MALQRLAKQKPALEDIKRRIWEMRSDFECYQVLLAAVELDLFSHLQAPMTAESLAAVLALSPLLTAKTLDILAAAGFLDKSAAGYANTAETTAFLTPAGEYSQVRYLLNFRDDQQTWLNLKYLLKGGSMEAPPPPYEYRPEVVRSMGAGSLLGRLQETVGMVTGLPEFPKSRKVLDLGGSHGLFAIALAQENPRLQAFVFDRPNVVPITREYIAQHGMEPRVHTIPGDYNQEDLGEGYDLVLQSMTHAADREELAAQLGKIHGALAPDGLLVNIRSLIDDDRRGPLTTLIWDLKSYLRNGTETFLTRSKFVSLLEAAGFKDIAIQKLSTHVSTSLKFVVARKQGHTDDCKIEEVTE